MIVYSSTQRPMAPPSPGKSPVARPSAAPRGASYSHQPVDNKSSPSRPQRAQTFQNDVSPGKKPETPGHSAFEADDDDDESDNEDAAEVTRASIELDVLPIELVSLTDRYVWC